MNKGYKLERNFTILMDAWKGRTKYSIAKEFGIADSRVEKIIKDIEKRIYEYFKDKLSSRKPPIHTFKGFMELPDMDRKELAKIWYMRMEKERSNKKWLTYYSTKDKRF